MRIVVLACAVATAGGALPARARPRLSPALGFVASRRMAPEALPHLADGRLQVWVRFGGSADALRAAGFELVSHAGAWWTARVPPDRLNVLPEGVYVEEAHQLFTQLD